MRYLDDTHAQQRQGVLPLTRLERLREDVGCLEVGLNVLDLDGIGVHNLFIDDRSTL